MDEIDDIEADLVCENEARELSVPLMESDDDLGRLRWTEAIGSLSTFARV